MSEHRHIGQPSSLIRPERPPTRPRRPGGPTPLRVATVAAFAAALAGGGASASARRHHHHHHHHHHRARHRGHHRVARPSGAPCGIHYLPLAQGNQWTYEYLAPTHPPAPGQVVPTPPQTFTIKVVAVKQVDKTTEIDLDESFRKVTQHTVLHCSKDGLDISPQSFFFAAEPGGGLDMTLSKLQRQGHSYPAARAGLKPGSKWDEAITAMVTHNAADGTNAKLASGKMQVERQVAVTGRGSVDTPLKSFRHAVRVDFMLSGRSMVAPDLQTGVEIPAGAKGVLWFVRGVGVVRAQNRFGVGWQLKSTNLVKK